MHCIAATDKLSAAECGRDLAGYLQLQLRSSPLPLLLLQLKHENLLRSGDSWSPPIWMAWADSVLAILMGQTQPKLASVSRNAHPVALPALWPNILLAQSRLLPSHRDSQMIIIMHRDFLFLIAIFSFLQFSLQFSCQFLPGCGTAVQHRPCRPCISE